MASISSAATVSVSATHGPSLDPDSSTTASTTASPTKVTDDEFKSILALFERVIVTRAHAEDMDIEKMHTAYIMMYPPDRPRYMETKVYQWLYGQEWDIEYEWFLGRR